MIESYESRPVDGKAIAWTMDLHPAFEISDLRCLTHHQIPSDLVVKSQATDIIGLILRLIRHQNGVHRSCRNRTSRGAVLSTSEVQWATTKFDGVCYKS